MYVSVSACCGLTGLEEAASYGCEEDIVERRHVGGVKLFDLLSGHTDLSDLVLVVACLYMRSPQIDVTCYVVVAVLYAKTRLEASRLFGPAPG